MDKKQKTNLILKIVGTAIYTLITAILIVFIAEVFIDRAADEQLWELGGVLLMIVTLLISIAYIVPIGTGIAGVVISNRIPSKKDKIFFIFMIVIPIVTAIANFATYLIILK